MLEGPFSGKVVGTAEKVQMENARIVSGKVFSVTGRIRASWGVQPIDTLDIATIRSIGIGKTFKSLGNQLGQINGPALRLRGVDIQECGFISLGSASDVSFALHKV